MRYKVSIYDDPDEIARFLKANGIRKFSVHRIENNHGVYGFELLGFFVNFKTSDRKLIRSLQAKFDQVDFHIDLAARKRFLRFQSLPQRKYKPVPLPPKPDDIPF